MGKDIFRMTKRERTGLLVCIAILACVCGGNIILRHFSQKSEQSRIVVIQPEPTAITPHETSDSITVKKTRKKTSKRKKQKQSFRPPKPRDYRNEPIN
ncbi:MAG: hypothetical protein K2O12_04045 [Muribaculaceae bacterium]|nr:hypothetical protein [Muribaculaceae bacterium]